MLNEQAVFDLNRKHGLDRIIALGEDSIIRAARLRKTLGVAGQSLESVIAYRNKVVMKKYPKQAMVPNTGVTCSS